MWKNIVEPDRPQMKIWRMRIASWIPKATDTHSECIILIASPVQQWLQQRSSLLRYTYTAFIVIRSIPIILFIYLFIYSDNFIYLFR
jgi:hypothetical protein